MILHGKAHKLGDKVSTDAHASDKYRPVGTTPEELRRSLFVELDPELPSRVKPGDILVAGEAFGMSSSREDAIEVMKGAGFSAVLASSFGSLFHRNAINLGLPVLECDTTDVATGDELEVDLATGRVSNLTRGVVLQATILPATILQLVIDGGLIPHLKKRGDMAVG